MDWGLVIRVCKESSVLLEEWDLDVISSKLAFSVDKILFFEKRSVIMDESGRCSF